jgi:hypothetical protein
MKIIPHISGELKAAEIVFDGILIRFAGDALDIMADMYFQGFIGIILYGKNINPDFFDLKTGLAGEILQKFSTYGIKLAIIGDFSIYPGKSLRDFIYESNKGNQVFFLSDKETAVKKLLSV